MKLRIITSVAAAAVLAMSLSACQKKAAENTATTDNSTAAMDTNTTEAAPADTNATAATNTTADTNATAGDTNSMSSSTETK
jgi:hypothetical protein